MKYLAIVGATGFVGKPMVNEAVNRGYKITAVARNINSMNFTETVRVRKADAFNEEEMVNILKGHDVVISCYNPGWTNPEIYKLFIEGNKKIQQEAVEAGVKRLIVIGGAGSLELEPGVQLVDSDQFPAEYKAGALGLRDYLNQLKQETRIDWTFVSPAINLIPGTRTGTYRVGTDQPLFDEKGESKISVEDFAAAVMDEIDNKKFIRKRFTVGY